MPKLDVAPVAATIGLLVLATTGAAAQVGAPSMKGCEHHIGQASGATREAALQLAYEGMLEAVDPRMRRVWLERSRRIGDAPGYQVRKISSKCTARGTSQSCEIEAILCKG